jgi:two-component system response regulator (stage 0 sporulation protein F)
MKKILLVEDDEGQRITMSMALRGRGYSVDAVENWEEAVQMVEVNCYRGIILDVKLPTIDGIELARKIKDKKPDSKIILMSGFKTSEEMRDLNVDIEAFFEKPLNVDELVDCLNGFSEESINNCC